MVHNNYFPFISKEGEYFVIGTTYPVIERNKITLSKLELKRLKRKLDEIDIDGFFWTWVK